MMTPLVSILIPAYNAEPWIADTISSALGQTWAEKEIIVVDDGSTDGTLRVADQFSSRGVRVVSQKNQGASAARNKAYSLCHGDYIQWLDADDLLAPDKISRQMEMAARISNPRALFSCEWGRFIYRLQRAQFVSTPLWADLSPVEWMLRKLGRNLYMPPFTWLVSRALTEAAAPWDERLSLDDDGEYFSRVIFASEKIYFVPGARAFYRASGSGSLSNVDQSNKKLESLWLSLQSQIDRIRQLEESERTRAACVTFLQNWLKCFHPWRPDLVKAATHLVKALGGHLDSPRVRRKYAWIEKFGGYRTAARAEQTLPNFKMALLRSWDKVMFQLEQRKTA
jgi:glycosyltransferase involved in cell wall biosynthesis